MPRLTLDHLLIAVRDLDAATASYRRLLGRGPSWRGRHPTYGTANVLFRLDNCYLELIASAPDGADSPWRRALVERLDRAGEGLYAIAIGTDDIEASVARAREHGLAARDPQPGEGVDLDTGARREWCNARIDPATTRGAACFFIEHLSPPDALPPAPVEVDEGTHATAVDHTVVASSDIDASLALWRDGLGLDLRRTVDWPGGRRLHFLRLGDSILELAGEAEPERRGERDVLWGVSYRVGDVAKTVERLRAAGVDVSDARAGRAEGTAVADLKPGFSHDVRTLLIEKERR